MPQATPSRRSGFDYRTVISTNGYDLRFGTSETDTNSLNYEIEFWNTNGASFVWVQVPLLPGDGSGAIWANWGENGAKLPCTTNGATWTTDYQAVWHMQGINATDSTTNHNHATSFGGVSLGSGPVGAGVTLDGTNGYLEVAATDLFKGSDDVTIAFWINAAASQMANAEIMDYNLDTSPAKNWVIQNTSGTTPAPLQWSWAINNASNDADWGPWMATRTFAPVSNQWTHVTLVKSGTNVIYYTSGVQLSSATNFASIDKATRKLWIGGHVSGADKFLKGALDEIRIANAAKSADWVWACYLNQASNAIFASVGPASVPGAPGMLNVPASDVTASSATCNGWLISTGNAATAVCVLWGEVNAGTSWSWARTNWLDDMAWTNNSYLSTNITGLASDRTYYYTFGASNATTNVVASGPVIFFITGEVTVEATDNLAASTSNNTALFTICRPDACTNEAVTVNYALSGSASNGVDYVLVYSNVTMAAGVASAGITVTARPDRDTTNEEVVLTILPGYYAIGAASNATVAILPWTIAAEICVVPAGLSAPTEPYDTWATAANAIQTAVDYAGAFQPEIRTVVVSNGTYAIYSQILITNGITVSSFADGLDGAAQTIVMRATDAGNSRIFTLGHADAVLDGFTITGGSYPPAVPSAVWKLKGAGILMTNGTVRNCLVTSNMTGGTYGDGGGIFMAGGLVSNCVLAGNSSFKGNGGGLCMIGTNAYLMNNSAGNVYATGTGTRVTHCIISSNYLNSLLNQDTSGGGVYMLGGATLDNSLIYYNSNTVSGGGIRAVGGLVQNCTIVSNFSNFGAGGGVQVAGGVVEGCTIAKNYSASGGGGVYLAGGSLTNCLVQDNRTSGSGGGVYATAGQLARCQILGNTQVSTNGGGVYASTAAVLLRNCLIASNACVVSGGGVYGGTVESCTIASNSTASGGDGGGIYIAGGGVSNSIVYFNSVGGVHSNLNTSSGVSYSCTTNPVAAGIGNISADPLFMDMAGSDYRLPMSSPCLDAGSNNGWMTNVTDLIGKPRLVNGVVDMGAYEYAGPRISNQLVTNKLVSSATYGGWLSSTGASATAVCVLWGSTDGGASWAWDNTNWFDGTAWTNNSDLATNITGLASNTTYYYAFGAVNADGSGVAAPSVWFVLPTYRELWLAAYFTASDLLDPEISGDAADPDHDGMSNLQEYLAGTNPRSASSLLSITQTGGGSGLSTNFVIVWQSASNRMYMLEAATNLLDGFTLELATDIPATPPLNVHTDHLGGAVQKFYRVRLKQ